MCPAGVSPPSCRYHIHVSTAAAFYATNVFEEIRIYWNDERQEAYAFRLQEHFPRWFESMKMMRFSVPYTPADVEEALREIVKGNILESITRVTLLQLFKEEMGLTVKEQEIDRTQVYVVDEAFFCGSGYEVTPILSVDRFPVGNGQPGPIAQEILQRYLRVVRGTSDKHAEWRTPIDQKGLVTASST